MSFSIYLYSAHLFAQLLDANGKLRIFGAVLFVASLYFFCALSDESKFGTSMSGSRLFTIVASKNGFETVVCQEDAGNEADALKLAIGRLPVEFVEDGDLVGIGANFDGSAELVMLKTTRIHNVWSWPQAESLGLSFRVVIVDTRN